MKVLIVDDQPAFRLAAREVIAATEGFEVAGEAEGGEESVVAARRLHPDLVLMDVQMPGVDGMEASRRIRSEHSDVVVFLLSTYDREDFASGIAVSGAEAFIPKAAFGPESLSDSWKAARGNIDQG